MEYYKVSSIHEDLQEVIRKWKHFWMNQTQNDEKDRKIYFDRAFGIDSNMVHNLAHDLEKFLFGVHVTPSFPRVHYATEIMYEGKEEDHFGKSFVMLEDYLNLQKAHYYISLAFEKTSEREGKLLEKIKEKNRRILELEKEVGEAW